MSGDKPTAPAPRLRDEDPTRVCVECEATLKVVVRYGRPVNRRPPSNPVKDGELEGPPNFPIEGVTVEISGPTTASRKTDSLGVATFEKVAVGKYGITATYDQPKPPIVIQAERDIGSTHWAVATDRTNDFPGYGGKANKCNLYVYDKANEVGLTVSPYERFSKRHMWYVDYPPLAGDWSNSSKEIDGWEIALTPKVGDVVSASREYSDATGHLAIVAGPEPRSATKEYELLVGVHSVNMRLPWTAIGAGGSTVNRTEFPYDPDTVGKSQLPVFRRHKS